MLIIADDLLLYMMTFEDKKDIEHLKKAIKLPIALGKTNPIKHIEGELEAYFFGNLESFKTPLSLRGTPFQKSVWEKLQHIQRGKTTSYADLARAINKPSAYRAVALANRANPFAIAIPCHRVINSNKNLGGYNGGIQRKEWLLKHESKFQGVII